MAGSDSEETVGFTVTSNYTIISSRTIRWVIQMTCGVEYVAWDERFKLMGTLRYIMARRIVSREHPRTLKKTYNVNDPSCLTHTFVNP